MTPFAVVGYYEPWWIQLLKGVLIFAVVFNLVPIALLAERKLLGRFQYRYGPNRVGPYGIFQPMADIGKLLFKQQFRPRTSIGWLFALAPAISMLTAVATVAIIPFSNTVDIFGTQVGLYGIDPSIGILYAFAFGAIAFYGLMLGGWASGSKYSFLGAMRSAAQLISYEVAQGLSLIGVIMMTGSLSLTEIVEAQGDKTWFILPQFVGFVIFLVAGFAETNRPPFDLPEADAELVGGYNTEYGGGRFAAYFAAEYLNIVVVSLLTVTLFFGGWLLPFGIDPPTWVDPIVVLGEDALLRLPLHLGARHAAAAALRPADVARLEDLPAAGDAQRPRDRDPGGGSVDARTLDTRRRRDRRAARSLARAPPSARTAPSARR